jgi:hypothetical protein
MSVILTGSALDALTREIDEHAAQVAAHILRLGRVAPVGPAVTTDHGPTCCPPKPEPR